MPNISIGSSSLLLVQRALAPQLRPAADAPAAGAGPERELAIRTVIGALAIAAPIDTARVTDLGDRIRDGTYRVDLPALAGAMLADGVRADG